MGSNIIGFCCDKKNVDDSSSSKPKKENNEKDQNKINEISEPEKNEIKVKKELVLDQDNYKKIFEKMDDEYGISELINCDDLLKKDKGLFGKNLDSIRKYIQEEII